MGGDEFLRSEVEGMYRRSRRLRVRDCLERDGMIFCRILVVCISSDSNIPELTI